MCGTCGCEGDVKPGADAPSGGREVSDTNERLETHTHELQRRVLEADAEMAATARGWLSRHGLTMVNVMGAPGAGKTRLLETTVAHFAGRIPISIVEGDQATENDAERLRRLGADVRQINTGQGCHLTSSSVLETLRQMHPAPGTVVFVENVGNLVCPSLFDLGESQRVVVSSVTEGADKPIKYPHMFRSANIVVLNKMDVAPYVEFDEAEFRAGVTAMNPDATLLPLSATRSADCRRWFSWCESLVDHAVRAHPP